jgi:hypothetical protein
MVVGDDTSEKSNKSETIVWKIFRLGFELTDRVYGHRTLGAA